jgi:outer membrane protein OmpA-like peptidoglycan-associated protein/opacity protein-like surface antigen
MKTKNIALASTLLIAAVGASSTQAADRHGWYFGLEGGVVHANNSSHAFFTNVDFERGWGGLAEVGYALNGHWRVELEGGYRRNEIDSISYLGAPSTSASGDLRNYTAMVNAIWDAPISAKWALSLGAGAGVDHVRFADTFYGFATSDKDTVFAAQGLAGLTYQMSAHWDLFLNYRYLWADSPSLTLGHCAIGCGFLTDDLDVTKHTLTIGFRYGFDSVEAPPPAAPPPAPPPEVKPAHFIIFFGFNKCNITAEADRVLSEAVDAAKSAGSAAVTIVGHTDTSGSTKYNQRLSECRANAAKTNMVGKGVPQGAISASGKGETELMVQTGDGVKEPQNRRATIDLH